jgi:hypothetical protein
MTIYILQETSSEDENQCAVYKVTSPKGQKAAFTVHEDKLVEENAVVQRDSKPVASDVNNKVKSIDLPATITNLHRQPLQEIVVKYDTFEEDSTEGSPMSLDKSGVLVSPIKQRSKSAQGLLLDVEEYREEIYLYLREAEVCKYDLSII